MASVLSAIRNTVPINFLIEGLQEKFSKKLKKAAQKLS